MTITTHPHTYPQYPQEPGDKAVSTAQAVLLAGCSYRQADYWTRIGLVEPTQPANGSGTARRWAEQDVRILHLVSAAMGRLDRDALSHLIDWARRENPQEVCWIVVTFSPLRFQAVACEEPIYPEDDCLILKF